MGRRCSSGHGLGRGPSRRVRRGRATGQRLGGGRLPEGVEGVARFHELVRRLRRGARPRWWSATETDRGLFVGALVAAGYRCWRSTRCRRRVTGNGTRPRAPSPIRVTPRCWPIWPAPTATTIGRSPVTASWPRRSRCWPGPIRAMIWTRQRQINQLRSTLREFYPAALDAFDDLDQRDALAVLRDRADARRWARRCRGPRSPRRCAAAAGNAASRNAPPRSRPRCAPSSSHAPTVVADAMGATVGRAGRRRSPS